MVANFQSNDPLTTVSQKNPCHVCGWVKKCAVSASGNNLVCGNSTATTGDIINGYKCVKTTNPNSHCSHSFVKVDQSSQATVKQSPKTTKPTTPAKPEMSREDRDLWNRKIIPTLKLNEGDRTHLKEIRGLTDQQIDDWGFRSVFPFQRLVGDSWPDNLPGYRHDKKQLAVSGKGILTPIKQLDQIVGFKVRLTEKKGDQRYTCVSDKNYTRYHIDGEQPLAVLIKDNNYFDHGIFVTEGNELKPVIVHLKYDLPVLGGARYWNTSKNHAAKFLPLVKEKSEIINLCLDAGDVLNNDGIPLKWHKEYKYFESQGFKPRFAYWGQISKESEDIDELTDISNFGYINLEQFKELIKEHNPTAYQQIEDLEKTPLLTLAVDNTKPSDDPMVTFNQISLKELFDDSHICVNEKFYQWQGKYHKELDSALVLKQIRDFCNSYAIYVEDKNGKVEIKYPFANTKSTNEVFKWAQISLAVSHEEFNKTIGINCTNGVVVIDWEHNKPIVKLEPHDPTKHFFTSEPIITYNPNADTKYCDQLLRCLDDKQLQVLLRNLGASLDLPTVRKFKGRLIKILFCIGGGSNGKDSIREVISLIYGSRTVSNFSLNDFTDYDNGNKNSLAGLSKARVNWASESGKTTRIDNSLSLKRFATGDTLTERYLFKDGIDYVPNAIALFNLNELPNLFGTGQAALDRFAPLMFNKSFVKQEDYDPANPNQELADPRFKYDQEFLINQVCPAFLNYMIQGLQELMVEGIDYSCTKEALENIQIDNNHLFEAAQDLNWHYDPNAKPIRIGELHKQLMQWYKNQEIYDESKGYAAWSEPHKPSDKYIKNARLLLPRLKEVFPKLQITELRVGNSSQYADHIIGISTTAVTKPASLQSLQPIANSRQMILCEAPLHVPPGAMATTPASTPNLPQIYPKSTPNLPQNENTSKPDISTVSAIPSTPSTPNCSKPLEKNSKEEIDHNFRAEMSQTILLNTDGGDGTVKNIERLDDFGVDGVDKNAENLTTQEIHPNQFGVDFGVDLGSKPADFGVDPAQPSDRTPTADTTPPDWVSNIVVDDVDSIAEKKRREREQEQREYNQELESLKVKVQAATTVQEHEQLLNYVLATDNRFTYPIRLFLGQLGTASADILKVWEWSYW
ncbi:hypothetical protein [Anabaena sp. UHCC 0204]|uniref:hypothetical protein n=1 Tax=Anabaena sp. UHCC 0204 TaxID=2590009 RepID=UPI0014466E4D|nr:hypothetical protein [Anabaena sp. UHCC 0204]MTJ10536.1 hypothetical protein [Anabaena sp. UHCC 0204]